MAAIAENPTIAEPAPAKKGRRSRKALEPKNASSNEANIVAAAIPEPSPVAVPPPEDSAGKENHGSLSQKKTKKGASKGKKHQSIEVSSFEKQLQEMQEQLEKLKIEKEQTEEMLKSKEEELETRDRQQEKLKVELKKLQKLKEFKPTMVSFPQMQYHFFILQLHLSLSHSGWVSQAFPLGLALKDPEQEKKEKKKGGKKKPSPPYVLWCKDQWNEVYFIVCFCRRNLLDWFSWDILESVMLIGEEG